jgi:modulator of FtsH protease HflC
MRNPTPWILAGLLLLMLALGSVFVVNESQTAIVLKLGKIARTDLEPGLHFKLPLIEDVRKFDRRLLSVEVPAERVVTKEKKDVEIDYFIKWRVREVITFYRNTSGGSEQAAAERIKPIVKNAINARINLLTLAEVVSSGRSDLTRELLAVINKDAAALGIEVVDVRIKRVNLPQESNILESVYNRMRAERTRVANQLRAEGTQAGETIRAEAERERQVILADAEREAQIMRGEGDGKAAEIAARAYGQDAEFYAFYRSLEAYRATLSDGRTVMVLDPDSEFLRYFGNDGR